jgi:glycosyltransferase involved in cell wall biosynthesis
MNWVFIDPLPWDYDVATPLARPLGGSQSALCYLARALSRRGHTVATLTATTRPREIEGVRCWNREHFPLSLFSKPQTIAVELNGPADIATQFRTLIPSSVPLVLWTQIAHNQPIMMPLADPVCASSWDRIVCVSHMHKQMFHERFGVPAERIDILLNAISPAFENVFRDADELFQKKSTALRLAYTSAPFRGLPILLESFPKLLRRRPASQLDVFSSMQVYSETGAQDKFQPLYAWCRATSGTTYHGSASQTQLAHAMRGVSILAYPNTFDETSCIAVMEALAAGALVVTSRLGALAETCAGFGRLVVPIGRARSHEQFAAEFLAELEMAVSEIQANPALFAMRQFEQVTAISARYRWDIRAREWEAAAAGWLKSHG